MQHHRLSFASGGFLWSPSALTGQEEHTHLADPGNKMLQSLLNLARPGLFNPREGLPHSLGTIKEASLLPAAGIVLQQGFGSASRAQC